MNEYQKAMHSLGILVGDKARAIWLAIRLDETPTYVVAKEHETSVGEVREVAANVDAIIEWMAQVGHALYTPTIRLGTYHPCYEGFHQMGDGE